MIGADLVLYTEAHRITGAVDPGAQRLSDFLNDPNTSFLELQHATYQEMKALANPLPAARLTVRKSEVLLVVPLDTPGGGGRVQTQQVGVHLGCPLFSISGNLHRRPADPTNMSAFVGESTRAFIPVSEATITYQLNNDFDTEVPVVLVHAGRIQFWAIEQSSPPLRLVF
jgi:hypothetical protein